MATLPSWRSLYLFGEWLRRMNRESKGDSPYPRAVLKKARNPKWEGPYYFNTNRWRHDLLLVLEQVRLNVKSNVALGPAFAMAARDHLDTRRGLTPQHITYIAKLAGLGILLLLSLVGALAALAEGGSEALPELLEPGIIGIWLIAVARHSGTKPVAVFAALEAHAERGLSLSESMARLPRFFPKDLVTLVATAERTGKLDTVLDSFTQETIVQWTAQRAVTRVYRYLYFGFIVQASIFAFMAVKVLPVYEETLQETGAALDHPTTIPGIPLPLPSLTDLYEVANFASVYRYHIAGFCWLIAFWFWIRPLRARRQWASRVESTFLLAIPGIRGMVARQNLGTIAFLLHQLLRAGVPLERALATVSKGDLHPAYRRWVNHVHRGILNGESFRDACTGFRMAAPLPRSFRAMVGMGELHGHMEKALAYLAEQYHGQVIRRQQLLRVSLLPLGVFLMGYFVLTIEAAVFQVLIDLADAMIV